MTILRMAPLISSGVSSSPPKNFSSRASSVSATVSSSRWRYSSAWPFMSPGAASARVLLAQLRVAAPRQGAVGEDVDDPDKVALGAGGQLDRQQTRAEALGDG